MLHEFLTFSLSYGLRPHVAGLNQQQQQQQQQQLLLLLLLLLLVLPHVN